MKEKISYLALVLCCMACSGPTSEMKRIQLEIKSSPVREEVSLESLGGSAEMIPLETTDSCLLSKVEQLVDQDFLWIVADKQIYKFSKAGKFIKKIGAVGQGPEEYVAPQQILVDASSKQLFVLDYFGRKTLIMDYEGKVLKTFPLPEDYSLNKIALVNNELLYTSYYNSVKPDLFVCNLETQQMDTVSFRDRTMGAEGFVGETFIYPLKGKTYLYHYFNDTVYTYANNRLTPDYIFDLGEHKYRFGELEVVGDNATKEKMDAPRVRIANFIETENYIFVPYLVFAPRQAMGDEDSRLAIYDKHKSVLYPDAYLAHPEHEALDLKEEEYKWDGRGTSLNVSSPIFASSDGNSIYTYKQAADLVEDELLPNLDPEDNPVLVKYTFKYDAE